MRNWITVKPFCVYCKYCWRWNYIWLKCDFWHTFWPGPQTQMRSFRWGSMVTLWNRSNINSSNAWSWRPWDERYWHQVFIGSLIDMNHLTELHKQAPPVPSDDVRVSRSFCSTSGFSVNDCPRWIHAHCFSFCFYQ